MSLFVFQNLPEFYNQSEQLAVLFYHLPSLLVQFLPVPLPQQLWQVILLLADVLWLLHSFSADQSQRDNAMACRIIAFRLSSAKYPANLIRVFFMLFIMPSLMLQSMAPQCSNLEGVDLAEVAESSVTDFSVEMRRSSLRSILRNDSRAVRRRASIARRHRTIIAMAPLFAGLILPFPPSSSVCP
jgi:hypothetical protein